MRNSLKESITMNKIRNLFLQQEYLLTICLGLMFILTLTPIPSYPHELTAPILIFAIISSIWLTLRLLNYKTAISFSSRTATIFVLTILVSICFTKTGFTIWTIHFLNFIIFFLIVTIEKSNGNFLKIVIPTSLFIILSVEVLKTSLIWVFKDSIEAYVINENIRGVFAVLCLPLVLKSQNLKLSKVSVLLILFLVYSSESRTALIGLALVGILFAIKQSSKIGKHKLLIGIMVLFGIGLTVITLQKLNLDKKESTEGRAIILKNTIQLIQKQSLFGSGIGSYQKVFADQLSSYFSKPRKISEKDNFKYQISIAYNDPLQIVCEIGLLGVIFMLTFIALIYFEFRKSRNSYKLMAFTAFGVMCMFNSLIYNPSSLYLLALYLALNESSIFTLPILANKFLLGFAIFCTLLGVAYNYGYFQTIRISNSQSDAGHNLKRLKVIRPILRNEDYYWSVVAQNFYRTNRLSDAKKAVKKQIERSNNVEGIALYSAIEKKQGNIEKALKIQEKINSIIPGNMDQKISLFYAYSATKNSIKAQVVSNEIIKLCENRPSNTCEEYFVKNKLRD